MYKKIQKQRCYPMYCSLDHVTNDNRSRRCNETRQRYVDKVEARLRRELTFSYPSQGGRFLCTFQPLPAKNNNYQVYDPVTSFVVEYPHAKSY